MKTVVVNDLSPEFCANCQAWYEALPSDKRAAVDAWLSVREVPGPVANRVIFAYCEVPVEIDPWITCRTAAADVTPEWIAKRQPLVQILPSGDMLSQFRESELREIASA